MSACTKSNRPAVGSEAQEWTPKPLILQWKHTRRQLSWQEPSWTHLPPYKHSGHHQSSPSPLCRFPVLHIVIIKDHKSKGSCTEGFILCALPGSGPLPPFCRQAIGEWVCSPQNALGIGSRVGTSLLLPHDLHQYPNNVDFSCYIYPLSPSTIHWMTNNGHFMRANHVFTKLQSMSNCESHPDLSWQRWFRGAASFLPRSGAAPAEGQQSRRSLQKHRGWVSKAEGLVCAVGASK